MARWLRAIAGVVAGGLLLFVGLVLWPIPTTVPPIQPRPSTQFWTLSGGYRIAYTHVPASVPSGAPVIALHGGPGGYVHSSTIEVLGRLSEHGRDVYLYDQSGTGLSDRRARPSDTSFESHLTDLHEIVTRHLEADRVVLLGHSFGGFQAATYATRHPERIEALVLSAPAGIEPPRFDELGVWENLALYPPPVDLPFVDVSETYVADTSAARLPVRALASLAVAHFLDRKLASDSELDAALNTLAVGFTRNMVCDPSHVQPEEGGGGAYMRTRTNWFDDDYVDPRADMAAMPAPVLVLQGACDFIPYESVYEYVDRFPSAQYEFVDGAGHVIYWDRPDEYVARIAEFLGGLE